MGEVRSRLTERIIGAAMEVHRELGPGLLEPAYEACLEYELRLRGLEVERQGVREIVYKGIHLPQQSRTDLVVGREVVVELKATDQVRPVHEAQVLSYMKLAGYAVGLLINFHVPLLKDGVRRFVL